MPDPVSPPPLVVLTIDRDHARQDPVRHRRHRVGRRTLLRRRAAGRGPERDGVDARSMVAVPDDEPADGAAEQRGDQGEDGDHGPRRRRQRASAASPRASAWAWARGLAVGTSHAGGPVHGSPFSGGRGPQDWSSLMTPLWSLSAHCAAARLAHYADGRDRRQRGRVLARQPSVRRRLAGRARGAGRRPPARPRAGRDPDRPGGGAVLRFLAATVARPGGRGDRHRGRRLRPAGWSAAWRRTAYSPSIDTESEHQRVAQTTFAEVGITANRVRLINGRALEVLPRLTDGAYDLVFCDAATTESPPTWRRRCGCSGRAGSSSSTTRCGTTRSPPRPRRDPETVAARELLKAVREDERLVPVLLPVSDGLLAAVRTD